MSGTENEVERAGEVLSRLLIAWTSVQLYPPGNPAVRDAVESVLETLNKFFSQSQGDGATGSDMSAQSDVRQLPNGAEGDLFLEVSRDRFLLGDREVCEGHSGVRRFAREIYRLGVKGLCVTPGVSAGELTEFLASLAKRPGQNRTPLAIGEDLARRGVSHISIEEAQPYAFISAEEASECLDMQDYIRRLRIHRQAMRGQSAEGTALRLPETEELSDIAAFFLEVANGAPDACRCLFNTLADSARLAASLTHIWHTYQKPLEEAPLRARTDVLRRTLRGIAESLASLPAEDRAAYLQNVAESIGLTDPDTHSHLITKSLPGAVAENQAELDILSYFSNESVATILGNHATFHNGTADTLRNFLEEFIQDPIRQRTVRELIISRLSDSDEARLRQIAELLQRSERARPAAEARPSVSQAERDRLFEERDALMQELALRPEETNELGQSMVKDCSGEGYDYLTRFFLVLRKEFGIYPNIDSVSELLQKGVLAALEEKRYEALLQMLELHRAAVDSARRDGQEMAGTILFPHSLSSEHLDRIVETLTQSRAHTTDYVYLLRILQMLGDPAFERLFLRLTTEEDPLSRAACMHVFAQLGEETVPCLSRKAREREWFVARSTAQLLGKVGSPAGLEALRRLTRHEDPRVRKEAVTALRGIRGQSAQELVADCLQDPDPSVAALAADSLRAAGAPEALPMLVAAMRERRRQLRKQPDLAVSVVRAVGSLGGRSEIEALREFSPPRWLNFVSRLGRITQACQESIQEIHDRLQTESQERTRS